MINEDQLELLAIEWGQDIDRTNAQGPVEPKRAAPERRHSQNELNTKCL